MPDRTTYARRMPKIYGNLQPKKQVKVAQVSAWFVYLVITCGSAVLILYTLFFGPLFKIKNVEVEGTQFSSRETARASILIGSNIWLLKNEKVAQAIMVDPSVLSVQVFRGLPATIRLNITERPPALLWTSGDTVSLVDDQGQVFKQVPSGVFSNQNIPSVHDDQGLFVADSQSLVSPTFVSFVQRVSKELEVALPSLPVTTMSVNRTTYALQVALKGGPTLVFSALSPASVQVRNAAALITSHKVAATSRIDLRVDRWAYVR